MTSPDFKHRWLIIACAIASLGVVLVARLIDVQVVRGARFFTQAEDNRLHIFPLFPDRGVFLDRYQDPLVWNQHQYGLTDQHEQLYQQSQPVDRSTALAVMATDSARIIPTSTRFYRYNQALAHVLGYVGAVTAEDLQKNTHLHIQEQVGKAGLEVTQESEVHGFAGEEEYEINALGKRQRPVRTRPAVPGKNLATTLDPFISEVALQAFNGQKGAVVVIDTKTGDILSLVSSPSYDPNLFLAQPFDQVADQQRRRQVSALFEDLNKPLFNRAVGGAYPPGSVFKLVAALAGLESKAVDSSTIVVDEGVLRVGEYEYRNWLYRQRGGTDGPINVVRAITRSNDIYFYKLAEWTGPDTLARYARLFGFGSPVGIDLPGEAKGLVPDPAWKEAVIGEKWYLGNTYHYGIGQGDILVTPVQIAQMMQALANEGRLCRLHVLKNESGDCRELGLQQQNLELVWQGMLDACSPGGTGYLLFDYNAQKRVAGSPPAEDLARGAVACKTGTAEWGPADEQGRRATHGWFVSMLGITKEEIEAGSLSPNETEFTATDSATLSTTNPTRLAELRQKWLEGVREHGFPERIAIVALVESDENQKFKEGSREAGQVTKAIVEWIVGR
jgi:penicillin-binding protein 2